MAKRLNKKMVVGLTITGMVVTTVGGFAMLLTLPSKNPQVFVDQAKQFEAQGDYRRAAMAYRGAAQRAKHGDSGEDPNAFLITGGDVALKGGHADVAISLWRDALLDDPNHAEAQRRMVDLYFEIATLGGLSLWQQVQQEAEKLKNIPGHENDYAALHALGRALIGQRGIDAHNAEEGLKYLIAAVEGDKSNPEYAESLARYYLSEEKLDNAEEVYNVLLSEDNRSEDPKELATAYRYCGGFHLGVQEYKNRKLRQAEDARAGEAEKDALRAEIADSSGKALANLERARELAPDNVDVLITLGNYWELKPSQLTEESERKSEEAQFKSKAEEFYKSAIAADKDGYDAYLQLSRLHSSQGETVKALTVLGERMERGITKDHYLGWRNRLYMGLVREEAFRLNLVKAVDLARSEPDVKVVEKKMKPIRQRLEELYAETIAETQGGEQDAASLYMQGRLLMLDNRNDEAIPVLEKADSLTGGGPQSIQIKRLLANLYVATGKPGLAAELLELILQVSPSDPAALTKMAQAQLAMGRAELADQYGRKATQITPDNEDAWRVRLAANRQLGNFEIEKEIIERLGGDDEQSKNLRIAMTLQTQYDDNPDPALLTDAEKRLRDVLSADPSEIRALRGLVVLLNVHRQARDEALKLLAENRAQVQQMLTSAENEGDRERYEVALKNIEALEIYSDPDADDNEKITRMEQLIRQGKDPLAVAVDLYQLYSRTPGREKDMVKALKEAYALRPDDPTLVNTLFRQALFDQDWKLAEEMVDKAIEMNLDNGEGHFFRGRYFLGRPDLDNNYTEAARELRAGLAIDPNNSNGHVWLGHALLQANSYDEANTQFKEALRINGGNHNATVGLAMVATAQNDLAARDNYLRTCAREVPNHPWVRAQLQRLEEQEKPEQGIARREQIRQQTPEDLENLLQLALLYVRVNQIDKAREVYEQARQIDPKELAVVQRYTDFLIRKSPPEPETAEKVLRETVASFDASSAEMKGRAQLLLGQHLYNTRDNSIDPETALKPVDSAMLEAAAISPTLEVQREIGRYFIQTGRNDRAEEWLRKAIASAGTGPPAESERITRTILLESMLSARDPARAPDIQKEIDTYHKRWPADPGYLLFQAELHALVGRDDDAIDAFTRFIETSPNPAVGHFRRALLRSKRGMWADAAADLQELKRLSPSFGNYQPRILLAKALEAMAKPLDAIAELNGVIEAQPNQNQAVQELVSLYLRQQPPMTGRAGNLVAPRLQAAPDQPFWLHLMAQIQQAAGDADKAEQLALDAARNSKWDNMLVDVLLDTALSFKRFDDVLSFANETIPKE